MSIACHIMPWLPMVNLPYRNWYNFSITKQPCPFLRKYTKHWPHPLGYVFYYNAYVYSVENLKLFVSPVWASNEKKQQGQWPKDYNDLYKRKSSDNALAKLNGCHGVPSLTEIS